MANNVILQQILGDGRRRRKIVMYAVLGIVTLVILNFVTRYSFVNVSYQGDSGPEPEVYAYDAETDEAMNIGALGGALMLRRDISSLLFRTETAETITASPHPFLYGSKTVQFRTPSTAKLISSGGQNCPLIIPTGVYSYTCTQPTSFSKYTERVNLPGVHTVVGSFSSIYAPARYADGLLIQRYTQYGTELVTKFGSEGLKKFDYVIAYTTPGKPDIQKAMPKDLYNASDYLQVFTDTTNPKNTGFVAYNHNTGTGYYFTDINGTAAGKKIQRQYKLDNNNEQSSCTLVGKQFTCYHGFPGDPTHNVDTVTQDEVQASIDNTGKDGIKSKIRAGVIEMTDFSPGNPTPTTKVYNGPEDYGISGLYTTSDGTLFGQRGHAVDRLELLSETFTHRLITSYATAVAVNNNLNFVQNNKLFEYDHIDQAAYLRYFNSSENINSIVAQGSQLYSLSYSAKDPIQLLNLYQLTASQ